MDRTWSTVALLLLAEDSLKTHLKPPTTSRVEGSAWRTDEAHSMFSLCGPRTTRMPVMFFKGALKTEWA